MKATDSVGYSCVSRLSWNVFVEKMTWSDLWKKSQRTSTYGWMAITPYILLSCDVLLIDICLLSELYFSWAEAGILYSLFRSFLLFVLIVYHGHDAFVVNSRHFIEFFWNIWISQINWRSSSAEAVCDLMNNLHFTILNFLKVLTVITQECIMTPTANVAETTFWVSTATSCQH